MLAYSTAILAYHTTICDILAINSNSMAHMKLDTIDRKILKALQSDGRLTNAELAEHINLSPSACLRRVKQLEESGIIDGYVMLVNPTAIGRPTTIFVEITLESQSVQCQEAFEAAVRKNPEIMECYLMTGEADYLLRVAAGGTTDYERLHKHHLSALPGVARIKTAIGIRTVCKSTAYPVD